MRYRLSEIGLLFRTPLGRRQLRVHLYSRTWPFWDALGRIYRRTLARQVKIIAVVGSYGKTTTATVLQQALGLKWLNVSGKGLSQIAIAVLGLRPRQAPGVIEVAINRRGQMRRHARTLRPDVVVLTSIGSEHHRSLGDKDTIRDEKAKILGGLTPGGIVISNGDDVRVQQIPIPPGARHIRFGFAPRCDIRASDVVVEWPHGLRFTLHVGADRHVVVAERPC